jgi:NAD(P)-dependent dehydrogenase (short-subunit alcohol dehydrogenase family)
LRDFIAAAIRLHGRLDCAVNNAGTEGVVADTVNYPDDVWDRVMAINVKGMYMCMQDDLRTMLAQTAGSIVNVASICGVIGLRQFSAYNASKHAVLGLTKTAALEVATTGVRVNAVGPGFCDTPMIKDRGIKAQPGSPEYRMLEELHPMHRLGHPEEIGEAIAWLCSDAAFFVTGQCLFADGGYVAQ